MWPEQKKHPLIWPKKLKQALLHHLKHVQEENKMPSLQSQPPFSVHDVLKRAVEQGVKPANTTIPPAKLDATVTFILDLFEQSCVNSLLNEHERRTFHQLVPMTGIMAASNLPTSSKGSSKNHTAAGRKRLRAEELSSVPVEERLYYCTMLPVEYLLRLLASLPLLVSHYHILCGASRQSKPSYITTEAGKEDHTARTTSTTNPLTDHSDLWVVADKIIQHISENMNLYSTPDARYASLILNQD
jgi:hypothetical protein